MKERPILFSGAMVRAVLAGQKTQTRRLVRVQPDVIVGDLLGQPKWYLDGDPSAVIRCPHGSPGDRLWVRETHVQAGTGRVFYRADEGTTVPRWTPAIHMPRALSRIDLEVTAVRAQRLKNISEDDARAEGVIGDVEALKKLSHVRGSEAPRHVPSRIRSARDVFAELWDSINGERASWASNPWVWVVSFRRVRP